MRTFALVIISAALASAAPLVVRQTIVGQPGAQGKSVNGPTAIDDVDINNGAQKDSSLESSSSLAGSIISNPVGNTLNTINDNFNFHDNVVANPSINTASNVAGTAVVGNDNDVFPARVLGFSGVLFKRQASVGINDPTINAGALKTGSMDSDLSFNGANIQNPLGNSVTQASENTDVSDNSFVNPNWNTVSNNHGAALAGNDNTFIPINNQGMIVNLDPSFLALQQARQQALISQFIHHGLF
ncbi:hypothetical protein GGI12_002662 [Dipsacomyces acuminosporus]|nr:hypothetical protein GGI12_002662 [Dipsacomyces acuminosporus]